MFRLFLAGSVEEKMYERQVHKSGLEKTIFTEGNEAEKRYFDKHALCKVFEQIPDGKCELLRRFENNGAVRVLDPHRYDLVRAHATVVGISDHGGLYDKKRKRAFANGAAKASKRLRTAPDVEPGVVSDGESHQNQISS